MEWCNSGGAAEVSALTGAQLHERCPDQRSTHRNGYRERLLTTQVGDLTLAIPKLRKGSFFPNWLEPRCRVDKALYAVVMEAYTGGISTRKVGRPGRGAGRSERHLQVSGEPDLPGAQACR
jgi:transposase-like protein